MLDEERDAQDRRRERQMLMATVGRVLEDARALSSTSRILSSSPVANEAKVLPDALSHGELNQLTGQPLAQTPVLMANPGNYRPIERGQWLQLRGDGSRGNITSYTWTFRHIGSDSPGAWTGEKRGAVVDVRLLRSIEARLTVREGEREDSRSVRIDVVPRSEESWRRMPCRLEEERRLQALPLVVVSGLRQLHWGRCTCFYEPNPRAEEKPHNIHPGPLRTFDGRPSYQPRTGERNGKPFEYLPYLLEEIDDEGGPFHGMFWVARHHFEVRWIPWLNEELYPGTPLWQENVRKSEGSNPPRYDVAAFANATRDHERMHYQLVVEGLAKPRRKPEGALGPIDPIPRIEEFVGSTRYEAYQFIDRELESADWHLEGEDDHDEIYRRLKSKWDRPGRLRVHKESRDSGEYVDVEFESLVLKGDA